MRRRRPPSPLPILLIAFGLLVLLHSWATPLFEAPDEIWHYAYVRWLAAGQGLPAMDDDASGANQQVAQPPLYYALSALFSAPFSDEALPDLLWGNPGFGYQAPGTTRDDKNMLIHTAQERWPWTEPVWAVRSARLASLLFGTITVAAAWGLGWETFRRRDAALLTAALVAFHPQFVFLSGVVSNDSATAALATATLWATARILRRGHSAKSVLLAGALTGLAILAKTSALPLLGVVGLALLWQGYRERLSGALLATRLAQYGGSALLVGGWWYGRNWLRYGDPLGLTSHVETLWRRSPPLTPGVLLDELPLLVRSFWAAYGWGHVWWADGVYVLLSLGAVYLLLRVGWRALRRAPRTAKPLTAGEGMLVLAALWCGTMGAALLYWMTQVQAPHGRLLFPALGAWALLLTAGARPVHPRAGPHPTRSLVPARLFLLLLAGLSILAPGARLHATFAPPRLRDPASLAQNVALLYNDEARLLSLHVDSERVEPGETVRVRACWEALQPMTAEYTVFAQLLGPENLIVAARRTYPGLGHFPTSLWPVDRAFCDTYRLEVAPWAPAPLRYQLELGLFEAESGQRLPAMQGDGTPADPPVVAGVSVVSAELPAAPAHPLDVQLGETIALRGYDAPPKVSAGEAFTVSLHWEALAAVEEELVAFVHLWEPGAAAPLAQHDGIPRGGWFPTAAWQKGDYVPDTHILALPPELAPGRYPLWTGLYRPGDGSRLPVSGPEAPYAFDLVPLGEISIRE